MCCLLKQLSIKFWRDIEVVLWPVWKACIPQKNIWGSRVKSKYPNVPLLMAAKCCIGFLICTNQFIQFQWNCPYLHSSEPISEYIAAINALNMPKNKSFIKAKYFDFFNYLTVTENKYQAYTSILLEWRSQLLFQLYKILFDIKWTLQKLLDQFSLSLSFTGKTSKIPLAIRVW